MHENAHERPDGDLGARLRAKREQVGLTQAELARRLGTTTQTIYRWESGQVPRSSALRAIKSFLASDTSATISYLPLGEASSTVVHSPAQMRAIEAASARLSSGTALSSGEVALLHALFTAVDLEWPDG